MGRSDPITHLNVSVPNVAHNGNQFLSTRNALILQGLQNGKVLDPLQLVVVVQCATHLTEHILGLYVVSNRICARAEHDLAGKRISLDRTILMIHSFDSPQRGSLVVS